MVNYPMVCSTEGAWRLRAPRLARLIAAVQISVPAAAGSIDHVERLPDGAVGLLLRITEGSMASQSRRGDVTFVGANTRVLRKDVQSAPLSLMVRFQPGSASSILGVPADEITDCIVDVQDVWGAEGAQLRDRLIYAGSIDEMLLLLESALTARAERHNESPSVRLTGRAIRIIAESGTPIRIDAVAAQLGVTSRHLRRAFVATVGLGPKAYDRIARFQRVVHAASHKTNWTSVAIDAGYYDQSHMIADFRHFAGASPQEFRRRPAKSDRTVQLTAAGPVQRPSISSWPGGADGRVGCCGDGAGAARQPHGRASRAQSGVTLAPPARPSNSLP